MCIQWSVRWVGNVACVGRIDPKEEDCVVDYEEDEFTEAGKQNMVLKYCDMTPESRNRGARSEVHC
jgi:hypothetical protein